MCDLPDLQPLKTPSTPKKHVFYTPKPQKTDTKVKFITYAKTKIHCKSA